MKPDKLKKETLSFENIVGTNVYPDHVLILVYSGELIIRIGEQEIKIKSGDSIFLCWDNKIIFEKKASGGQPFRSVNMGFNQSFLYEFYQNLNKKKIPKRTRCFNNQKIIEISKNTYIESLYISMKHYFNWGEDPIKEVLEIKLTEAVYCLLATDKKFYSYLFDAVQSTKKTIQYTSKYPLYPHCITNKCMETAYLKLQEDDKITSIYMEVSYKNVRSIIQTYDNRYGLSLLN